MHITILSNGYLDGSFLSAASISPALDTIAPRTAYCMSFTAELMVSMVMPLMVRIWVFATRVSRPLALAAATAEVRRTPEVKRRAARSRVDRVEVEHSEPEETCACVCVGGVMLTRRHNRVRRAFCDALAEKRRGRIYLRGADQKKSHSRLGI